MYTYLRTRMRMCLHAQMHTHRTQLVAHVHIPVNPRAHTPTSSPSHTYKLACTQKSISSYAHIPTTHVHIYPRSNAHVPINSHTCNALTCTFTPRCTHAVEISKTERNVSVLGDQAMVFPLNFIVSLLRTVSDGPVCSL